MHTKPPHPVSFLRDWPVPCKNERPPTGCKLGSIPLLVLWVTDRSLKAWLWAFCSVCVFLRKHLWICWEYLIHEWAVKKPARSPRSSRSSLWALSIRRALLLSDTQVAIQKRQRDVVFWHRGGYYGNIVARPLWWHSACVFQCSFLPKDGSVVTMVTLNQTLNYIYSWTDCLLCVN